MQFMFVAAAEEPGTAVSLWVKCASRRRLRPHSQFSRSRYRRQLGSIGAESDNCRRAAYCSARLRAVAKKECFASGLLQIQSSLPVYLPRWSAPALRVCSAFASGLLAAASVRNTHPRLSWSPHCRRPRTSHSGTLWLGFAVKRENRGKAVVHALHQSPQRCLTPRSSGAPTAGHQARPQGTVYIFLWPGLASCRHRPLSSNVRPHCTLLLPTKEQYLARNSRNHN